jgi:hypothetical protein
MSHTIVLFFLEDIIVTEKNNVLDAGGYLRFKIIAYNWMYLHTKTCVDISIFFLYM